MKRLPHPAKALARAARLGRFLHVFVNRQSDTCRFYPSEYMYQAISCLWQDFLRLFTLPHLDIYALGITMYELCGGNFNTSGASVFSGSNQNASEEASDSAPASFVDVADDDFKRIVSTCIQRDPEMRYSSAADLQAELTRYLADHDVNKALELPVSNASEYWVLAPYEEQISPESLIKVEGPCTIGRSAQADITIPISIISDSHTLVTPKDGFLFVQDLGSRNGTFVNGFSVGRDQVFCLPGDVLSIGGIQLIVGCKR